MYDGAWFNLYGDEFGFENGKMSEQRVTHWMPLPEPPKK